MNKIWVGCFLTSLYLPQAMAQAPLSLEERLAQMEQRLKATEARAASAEAEIKTLKGQQQATTVARAAPATPRPRGAGYAAPAAERQWRIKILWRRRI